MPESVVVTGAGGGIGGAIASDLAERGWSVFGLDRPAVPVPVGVRAVPVDLTEEKSVQAAATRVAEEVPSVTAIVVAAGIQLHGRDGRLGDTTAATWRRVIDVNLTGTYLTLHSFLPLLLKADSSSVVLIGSPTGLTMSGASNTAYAASKAGMMALGRVLAADYAREGLRANVVVPGTTQTPLIEPLLADPQQRDALVAGTPLGRLGRPEDLVGIVRWLVSAESSFATGAFFAVDGGLTSR